MLIYDRDKKLAKNSIAISRFCIIVTNKKKEKKQQQQEPKTHILVYLLICFCLYLFWYNIYIKKKFKFIICNKCNLSFNIFSFQVKAIFSPFKNLENLVFSKKKKKL